MKELKIEIPEGYEIDKEKSSFEKIVFKKKIEVNCWEDLIEISGVYFDSDGNIFYNNVTPPSDRDQNLFLNKKYAVSALALAQISQLLPYYDANVDWTSSNGKFCICRIYNKIEITYWIHRYHVLAFNTRSEAERFLKHNEQLVKDFYMI